MPENQDVREKCNLSDNYFKHNDEKRMYYDLTQAQKRIWYTQKLYTESSMFNIGGFVKINGDIDSSLLREAIQNVLNINDSFKIRIFEQNGTAYQYFSDDKCEMPEFIDFSGSEDPIKEFDEWNCRKSHELFKLIDSPLYYFVGLKICEGVFGYYVKMHHIIADGWSVQIITNEIKQAYEALKNNKVPISKSDSYKDFIESEKRYLKSDKYIKNKLFWIDKFSNSPKQTYDLITNVDGNRKSYYFSEEETRSIEAYCRNNNISLNTFFVGLYNLYLNKAFQLFDITLGIPVLGRTNSKERNVVGMFVSSIPFRFQVDDRVSVFDFFKAVSNSLKQCYVNQRYPYNQLVKDLELSKYGYSDLYNVSINYYSTQITETVDGLSVENIEFYNGNQQYSMQIIIRHWDSKKGLQLDFDYKLAEYSEADIEDIYNYLNILIDKVMSNELSDSISKLDLLTDCEKRKLVFEYNNTRLPSENKKTVIDLFYEQVAKTPDTIALCDQEQQLTYLQLNELSNNLASYLKSEGIKEGDIIGLLADHSAEIIVAILGILKAGAAYLPLDIKYPSSRINYMLKDASIEYLLTNIDISDDIAFDGKVINLNNRIIYSENLLDKINKPSQDDIAYIIYTSGSTGYPKGAIIDHKGLANYIIWASKMYVRNREVFPLYSSFSFDLTVTSIFTPLVSGGQIEIYRDDQEEYVLYRIIKENKCSIIKLTPSHLNLMKDMDCTESSVTRLIVGGEILKTKLARQIYDNFSGNIEIYNEYGPTEAVVGCMIYKYNPNIDTEGAVPIGKPIDNTNIYILDKNYNPMPIGKSGEICISGDGVCRGYLNKPDLTAEKFVKSPFDNKVMYKTGDMGKFITPDCIDYIGRIDKQVKIRGHRIELHEIEQCLLLHGEIKNSVVIHTRLKTDSDVLCAYYEADRCIPYKELCEHVLEHLPSYMLPAYFIKINEIPVNGNGKVDRALLPIPSNKNVEVSLKEESTKYGNALIKALEEILSTENINLQSNFYQFGGDSIKAIQISSKLSAQGFRIKVKDILSNPLVKDMILYITEDRQQIEQNPCHGFINATPVVEWFFKQKFTNPNHYNQSVFLEVSSCISKQQLQNIFGQLVNAHDSLRINYNLAEGRLFYNPNYLNKLFEIKCFDLSKLDVEKQQLEIRKLSAEVKASLNIFEDLLIKATLYNLGNDKNLLLITAHHLVIDGVSWRIILDDISRMLHQQQNKLELSLPEKTHSYQYWANKLYEYIPAVISEETYWKNELDCEFSFPIYINSDGLAQKQVTITVNIDEAETSQLIMLANKPYHTETNELLLTALLRTIKEISKSHDILLELEGHGREEVINADISHTVGWFTTIYPFRALLTTEELSEQIKYVKEKVRSIPNKGLGFGILRYLSSNSSLPEKKCIRFNYLGDVKPEENNYFKVINSSIEIDTDAQNRMSSIIDINCMVINKVLNISITYDFTHVQESSMNSFAKNFINNIKLINSHCVNKKESDFTKSDFDTANLSLEDLDSLFT